MSSLQRGTWIVSEDKIEMGINCCWNIVIENDFIPSNDKNGFIGTFRGYNIILNRELDFDKNNTCSEEVNINYRNNFNKVFKYEKEKERL